MEIGDVIRTDRGDQATNVRLLPVENGSTAAADAGVPEDAANEEDQGDGQASKLQ